MILDNKQFMNLVERNLLEGILLSNGFKNDLNQHQRFSKKISGNKLNVDIGPDYIKIFVNTTMVLSKNYTKEKLNLQERLDKILAS